MDLSFFREYARVHCLKRSYLEPTILSKTGPLLGLVATVGNLLPLSSYKTLLPTIGRTFERLPRLLLIYKMILLAKAWDLSYSAHLSSGTADLNNWNWEVTQEQMNSGKNQAIAFCCALLLLDLLINWLKDYLAAAGNKKLANIMKKLDVFHHVGLKLSNLSLNILAIISAFQNRSALGTIYYTGLMGLNVYSSIQLLSRE